jgi:hypothetical protein
MKPFVFPLTHVLNWHRTQCDVHESAIRQFCRKLEQANSQLAQTRSVWIASEHAVLGRRELTRMDLDALAGFRLRLRRQEQTLLGTCREIEARLAEERGRWLEVRRRVRMLEKLKARRVQQYVYEHDRELEQFAAEMYLAQWQTRSGEGRADSVSRVT